MCGTFRANLALGGAQTGERPQGCFGRRTELSGPELDSTGTGEGEQARPVSNHLRTPVPREGKQLARASSSRWQSLVSFTCLGAVPRPGV